MAAYSITSTNSVYMLSAPLLSIINYKLVGYAADDAFTSDSIDVTENLVGVDGIKSSGYTPALVSQNISLQADSPSIFFFETLYQFMLATKDVVYLTGIIQLPALQKEYGLLQGTLQSYKPVLDAQRVMQPAQFTINWGTVGVVNL
jgi:hypothetical protein